MGQRKSNLRDRAAYAARSFFVAAHAPSRVNTSRLLEADSTAQDARESAQSRHFELTK